MIANWNLVHLASGRSYSTGPTFDTAAVLLAAGHSNPYVGQRELDIQWLGQDDWEASASFEFNASAGTDPASAKAAQRVWLRLDGLDTITEVLLNGKLLGHTASAFTSHEFRIDELAVPGKNDLLIRFIGPEKAAAREAAKYSQPYPHSVYPIQSPHRNLIRKVQCHGGWDWGPSVMTSGVVLPPRLEVAQSARLSGMQVLVRPPQAAAGAWNVEISGSAECWQASTRRLQAKLWAPDGKQAAEGGLEINIDPGFSKWQVNLLVTDPLLWWPNGMGKQPLYKLELFEAAEAAPAAAAPILSRSLGFRDLELVSEEDEHGKSFFFKVNGVPFFAKGSNWIPTDALPEFQTPQRTKALLVAARDSNMNMIRAWGGGQYETDNFYETCDELGLLVWQDMMFSCGTYPAEPEFLNLVEQETVHQLRRLSSHPSIALWCGNNETLGSLTWYEESRANPQKFLVDWDRLYEGCIGRVVRESDPSRAYWPSSPSGGSGEFSDGWHKAGRGDMHYWSVWHEGKPFDDYFSVVPRFCSEFGFQSFPTAEGMARAMPEVADAKAGSDFASYPRPGQRWASPEEWNLTGPTVDYHQKSPRGNTIILETMARYYKMPSRLEDLFYISQVQQNRAFETAVDWWRSCAPQTMGALYWQLNDLWPVASWSSIEYPDKWKFTQHGAAHFFEPLRAALLLRLPQREPGKPEQRHAPVEALILNDLGLACRLRVQLVLGDFSGKQRVLLDQEKTIGSQMVTSLDTVDPEALELDGRQHFLSLRLYWLGFGEDAAEAKASVNAEKLGRTYHPSYSPGREGREFSSMGNNNLVSSSTRFFTTPKRSQLQDPGIQLEWLSGDDELVVRVRAKRPAFAVFLDSPGILGRWSDNAFDMLAGETRELRFIPREGGVQTWSSALRTARDEQLIKDAVQDGIASQLRALTRVYDLFSCSGTD